ncbi:MAG: molybdopterin-dependent oxidoreductase, partial [Rhodospirillaceae bacterium]|nr:molybdopterin-dependent oxidoreductase [Rhodospirillaceae bacterium]
FKAPSLPTGKNAVRTAIPVARIADLLSRPGERIDYNGEEIVLPDTKLVYWCGGNPFHHHQDLNNLARVWQRPETIVVHEIWWTATARRADIVLPATSTLERNDLGASSSDRFLIAMKRIAPPFAEARDDHRIFADLADRLGVRAAFTEDLSEMGWLERLYETSRRSSASMGNVMPSFAEFWEAGYFEYPELETGIDSLAAFRDDPSGRPLSTPSGRIEVVSERIESFGYADCPGHPVWIEPREWLNGPGADRHPLHLISNQPRTRLHSQLDAVGPSRDSKIQGREPLRMHPEDAAARGLVAGAVVRVFNDRGACLAGLGLSEDVRPGVVQLSTGAWFDPIDPADPFLDSHGNPNVLTHDHGTSALSQGPAAHSCLVEVEAFDGPLPPITVAGPPALLSEAP